MSCYIKFNGWAGEDIPGTTVRFAKIFRMGRSKASRAMHKIIKNEDWQFNGPFQMNRQNLLAAIAAG